MKTVFCLLTLHSYVQQVTKLFLLGGQVKLVALTGADYNRYTLHNLQAVAFQTGDLAGVIGVDKTN